MKEFADIVAATTAVDLTALAESFPVEFQQVQMMIVGRGQHKEKNSCHLLGLFHFQCPQVVLFELRLKRPVCEDHRDAGSLFLSVLSSCGTWGTCLMVFHYI